MTNSLKPAFSDFMLLLGFIVSIAVMDATYRSPQNWIGHAILGVASLALILEIDVAGAIMARRIRKPSGFTPFPMHRKASGQFLALSIGSFAFGIWIRFQHGDPLMATVHGWLGLIICILAIPQWLSCRYKVRKTIKNIHIILGYSLLAILIIQTILGAWMAYFPGSLG